VSVFSNQGSKGGSYELNLEGGFAPGTEVMEILNCTRLTANSAGNITVQMGAGEPKIFFPVMNLNKSGLCGFAEATATASGNLNSTNGTDSHKNSSPEKFGAPTLLLLLCAIFVGIM
jgi:alpha-amylase